MRRVLALALLVIASPAVAEVSAQDAAKASALFDEGRKLVDAGQIDSACDRFEASLALDPQVGTRLNLADCREKQGRLGEAYRLYEQAAGQAQKENKPGRWTFAKKRLEALAPKIARVVLKITDTPGLTLHLAGQAVPRDRWTQTQIVVPGTVVIDAGASGYKPVHVERTVSGGDTISIAVPALSREAPAEPLPPPPSPSPSPPPSSPSPPPATTVSATPSLTEQSEPSHPTNHTPLYVIGAGAVLLGASPLIALHAKSRWTPAYAMGDDSTVKSALLEADVATGFAIAGAITAGVGIYLLFTRGPAEHVVVVPSSNGGTLSFVGSF